MVNDSSFPVRVCYTGTKLKKPLFWVILLLAPLLIAAEGPSAKLSWTLPTSYADGTPIDPAVIGKIVVEVYSGPTEKGPWKWIATSLPGATSVAVTDPSPWETLWYTAKSNLSGGESAYAAPVRKTNYSLPILPTAKKIAKKMLARKKLVALMFLVFLLLLAGVVWALRVRGRNRSRIQ